MSNEDLIRHYNQKYFKSIESNPDNILEFTRTPSDRYEACINYFMNKKIGGNILEIGAGNGLITRSLLKTELKIDFIQRVSSPIVGS